MPDVAAMFPLCSAMYFSLRDNMMCSVRATWLVFAKGQLLFCISKVAYYIRT